VYRQPLTKAPGSDQLAHPAPDPGPELGRETSRLFPHEMMTDTPHGVVMLTAVGQAASVKTYTHVEGGRTAVARLGSAAMRVTGLMFPSLG
jgi:hypothetical protein